MIVLFHQCHPSLRLTFYAQEHMWKKLRLAPLKCPCKTHCWVSFTLRKISCDPFFLYINHLEVTAKSMLTSRVQLWIWNWCGIQTCCFKPSFSNSHRNYKVNIFKASDAEIMHSYTDAWSYQIFGSQSQHFHWSGNPLWLWDDTAITVNNFTKWDNTFNNCKPINLQRNQGHIFGLVSP